MAGKHCYSNSAGMFIFAFYPGRELYHSCVFLDYTYCNVFIYTSKKYHKKIALHWLSPQNIQTKKGMDNCYFLIHLVFQLYIRYYCEMGKVKIPFGFLSRNLKFQPKKKKKLHSGSALKTLRVGAITQSQTCMLIFKMKQCFNTYRF